MKKQIFLFCFAALTLFACDGAGDDTCVIKGTARGIDDQYVYLCSYENYIFVPFDSTVVNEGKFRLEIDNVSPDIMYLNMGRYVSIPLFIENGTVSVSVDVDSDVAIKKGGTPSNDFMVLYERKTDEYGVKIEELLMASNNAMYRDSANYEKYSRELAEVRAERDLALSKLKRDNNKLFAVAYLLYNESRSTMDHRKVDSLLSILDPSMPENKFKDYMVSRRDILEKVAPGNIAPDFEMKDVNGEEIALSSFRGKYTLVYFWGLWAEPCAWMNEELDRYYSKYRSKGFTILGVSIDTDKGVWKVVASRLKWPNVSRHKGWDADVVREYGVNSVPYMVLVDPEGVIVDHYRNNAALKAKLEELFETTGN